MKARHFLFATQREVPADADVISAKLMIKAGLIKKLASGLYVWLPAGLRVLAKVEAIVREEMQNIGAQEIAMPMVQPAELWQESGRFGDYGAELLRFGDRHAREFVLGPTHEEVVTDVARAYLKSHKQLPQTYFQIQSKFRDEIRPRFGVMRAREFLMKDAYSFHLDKDSLDDTYQAMYGAYSRILTRLGLSFRAVAADTGSIGGTGSHEFQVLADSGEDLIALSDSSNYAANIELAPALCHDVRQAPSLPISIVPTPNMPTCEMVATHLDLPLRQTVKTLIVQGAYPEHPLVALVLRGDHTLNTIKAEKLDLVASPLTLASEEALENAGLHKGYIGVNLHIPVLADRAAAALSDFVCGGNAPDTHATGVNWERDASFVEVVDIRNVVHGDPSPDGQGTLQITRGIEVGHIFKLGDKYSQAMNCTVLGKDGKPLVLEMGCYGIGVSRIVAAAIEQNHDERGIIWADTLHSDSIAPFYVVVVPMFDKKDDFAERKALELYQKLHDKGVDVLLDDRDERAGVKFADLDLLGIPHRIVVSAKHKDGAYEYKARTGEAMLLSFDEILHKIGLGA